MRAARLIDLGRREYGEVWKLQQELVAERQADAIPDTLVLVEHPDVITLGRRQSSQANVVAPGDIPIFEIERGGDVTYHGPGQLVGYRAEGAYGAPIRHWRGAPAERPIDSVLGGYRWA